MAILTIGILLVLAIPRDAFRLDLRIVSVVGIVLGLSCRTSSRTSSRHLGAGGTAVRIGDTIDVGGDSGVVEEITFRTTLLRTPAAQQVIVPNGTFHDRSVVNLTRFRHGGRASGLSSTTRTSPSRPKAISAALRDASAVAKGAAAKRRAAERHRRKGPLPGHVLDGRA